MIKYIFPPKSGFTKLYFYDMIDFPSWMYLKAFNLFIFSLMLMTIKKKNPKSHSIFRYEQAEFIVQ